jgi:hypothetical protein
MCIINGENATITASLPSVTAYGCGNEIDIMNNSCGYGTAVSGEYFLCLADGDGTCPDGCTLKLSEELVQGNTYTISYFDRGWDENGCCPPGVPLEVGVYHRSCYTGNRGIYKPGANGKRLESAHILICCPKQWRLYQFTGSHRQHTMDTHRFADDLGGCPPPTTLLVNHNHRHYSDIKMESGAGSCFLCYKDKASGTSAWTGAATSLNHVLLSTLDPSTKYVCRVKTILQYRNLISNPYGL